MRSVAQTVIIVIIAVSTTAIAIGKLSPARATLRFESGPVAVVPSVVAKIAALQFRGFFSDIIFFRALTYYGGKIIHREQPLESEWQWFYQSMVVATDLDPYFLDPYYLGSINLAWEANKVDEANALLEKGLHARSWDWTIPFYLGFNYFYFRQDNEKASHYLMEAAKRPGGSGGLVPTLAARLAHTEGRTETAMAFLEDILKKTDHEPTRYVYNLRLNALKRVLYLERATGQYSKQFKRLPPGLDDLVKKGIIPGIPADPYGGTFYITGDGRITTTSNFMVQRK